jgi:putative peptide zinc metalloprotease protein
MHVDLPTEAPALHRGPTTSAAGRARGGQSVRVQAAAGRPARCSIESSRDALAVQRADAAPWVALLGVALVVALGHAGALVQHAAQWLPTQRYLMLIWLAYSADEAVHELAHALAVRRFGGDVREVGATFLMLTPVPMVDASAANAFDVRAHRVLVSAPHHGGARPGVDRTVGMGCRRGWPAARRRVSCLFVGTASTLLVNGNPWFAWTAITSSPTRST